MNFSSGRRYRLHHEIFAGNRNLHNKDLSAIIKTARGEQKAPQPPSGGLSATPKNTQNILVDISARQRNTGNISVAISARRRNTGKILVDISARRRNTGNILVDISARQRNTGNISVAISARRRNTLSRVGGLSMDFGFYDF